ncbi:14390_t:CDS:1, partial [Acaulospora morrowiae]
MSSARSLIEATPTVLASASANMHALGEIGTSSNLEMAKNALGVIGAIGDA